MAPPEGLWTVVGGSAAGGIIVRSSQDKASPKETARLATGASVRVLERDGDRLHYELVSGDGPKSGWVAAKYQEKDLLVKVAFAELEQRTALTTSEPLPTPKDRAQVLRELERDLGFKLEALNSPSTPQAQVPEQQAAATAPPEQQGSKKVLTPPRAGNNRLKNAEEFKLADLKPTFGYAGTLDEHAPYARFDIRDEVCLQVGGFRHGQVVRDRDGNEFMVVGVKPVEGKPQLWFQPRDMDRPGGGAFQGSSRQTLVNKLAPVKGFSKDAKFSCTQQLCQACPADFRAAEDSDGEEGLLCCQCRLPVGDSAYIKDEAEGTVVHGDCWPQVLQEFEQECEAEEAALKKTRRAQYGIGWTPEHIPRNEALAQKLQCPSETAGMCCLVLDEDSQAVRLAATSEPSGSVNLEYLAHAIQVRYREGREPRFSLDPIYHLGDPKASMQVKRFEPEWLAGTRLGEAMFQADYHLKELSMGEYEQPVVGMKSVFDHSSTEEDKNGWKAREWFVVRKADIMLSEDKVLVPHVKMGVEAREQAKGEQGLEDSVLTRPDHPCVKYAEAFTHHFDLIAERKSSIFHLRELAKASVLAKFMLDSGISLEEAWLNSVGEGERYGCDRLEIPQIWNERFNSQVRVEDGKVMDVGAADRKEGGHGLYGGVEFGLTVFRLAKIYTESSTRGVDLNLDRFSLCVASPAGQAEQRGLSAGLAFWKGLAGEEAAPAQLKDEDRALLAAVFNPHLTDRRDEGEKFVPPVTTPAYLQKLRGLVQEEEAVRQRRRDHFCSSQFEVGNAGSLFPASWTSRVEVARGASAEKVCSAKMPQGCSLRPRPDYAATPEAAAALARVVRPLQPVFDQRTEDGSRYRIYRFRGLEVRSVEDYGAEEVVGAVFAIRATLRSGEAECAGDHEKVAKVTEYVERAACGSRRSYVVLETEQGHVAVMEKLADGSLSWKDGPEDLEARNALAKVVGHTTCSQVSTTVSDMKAYQAEEAAKVKQEPVSSCSVTEGRRYVQGAYLRALMGPPAEQKRTAKKPTVGFRAQPARRRFITGAGGWERSKPRKESTTSLAARRKVKYSEEQYKDLGAAMRALMSTA
jgi:hypothetical protein